MAAENLQSVELGKQVPVRPVRLDTVWDAVDGNGRGSGGGTSGSGSGSSSSSSSGSGSSSSGSGGVSKIDMVSGVEYSQCFQGF
jgi:hypothetical protein